MVQYEEIIIFGCGGVGSWVSNFLVRNKVCKKLTIVDFDKIEEKNLQRQDFVMGDVGHPKVDAVENNASVYQNTENEEIVHVMKFDRKIMDSIDLEGFSKDAIAIISTDNISSKVIIGQYFKRILVVNCDKNFVEVKNHIDSSDTNAWDMGGGYSNSQDIISNLYASTFVYCILKKGIPTDKRTFVKKIESEWEKEFKVCC